MFFHDRFHGIGTLFAPEYGLRRCTGRFRETWIMAVGEILSGRS